MILVKKDLLAYSLAALVISFAKPVYTWWNPSIVISIFFLIFIILFLITNKIVIRKDISIVFFFLVVIYIFTPFREFDEFKAYYLTFLFSCFIVFLLDQSTLEKFKYAYLNIMYIISILTIISSLFFIFKLGFPSIQISNEGRRDIVYLYYFSTYLDSEIIRFPGGSIYRANGWFQEPGHYGIYLGIALTFLKDFLKSIKGYIIILSIFLTFSASAYIILLVLVFINYFSLKKITIMIGILLLGFFLYSVPFFNGIINEVILVKFQGGNILDERTKGLIDFNLQDYGKYLFGQGIGYLDYLEIVLSDYRRFIVSSGYIGLLLLISMYFYLLLKAISKRDKVFILGLVIIFIIFTHRSWAFYQGFVWLYLAVMMANLSSKKGNINAT